MKTNSKYNILLIDDDPAILKTLGRLLEGEGYNVITASDGREGLNQVRQQQDLHLIITDIVMPKTDGLEIVLAIKNHGKKIPVIAISGGSKTTQGNYLATAKKLGACRTFLKPVDFDNLRQAVQELLVGTPAN